MILASTPWLPTTLAAVAVLAYAVSTLSASGGQAARARQALRLAWALHAGVLAVGLLLEQPRFGFATALSVTAWLTLAVYAIEQQIYPQLETRRFLAALGGLSLVLALLFPGSPLHAQASAWLPLHLALGVASYGLFAAAAAHAWLMNRTEDRIRLANQTAAGLPLLTLERLTFRFVKAGFVLLSATLLAGLLFGESLYGTQGAWRWDHKTVFSVLSWLAFAVLLLGHARFGWRGRPAARLLFVGFGLLMLGYVGSRFVLEVILERNP